jgi:ADP-ribose pyrophosphatase
MIEDADAPAEVMWEGKYVRAVRKGRWEYVGRTNEVRAVVILAEHDGRVILIDQPRVAVGGRCLELPAGLVGDVDRAATIEDTAIKELEEETGFTAERVERLGDFHASPGMVSESFTLVRAHGVTRCGDGGGVPDEEDINVHLVEREEIPAFVEQKRREGFAVDVKLLLFMRF